MNAGAPTCSTCGGINTNPQAAQCRFCGRPLAHGAAHGAQPYGGPPPPGGYGAPPPYGGPQPHAGPQPYGAPGPHGGYGPPNPYGAPDPHRAPSPYGGPQPYPVQGFGAQPFQRHVDRSGWSSAWSTVFWVRLVIAAIAIGISVLGACVSALGH